MRACHRFCNRQKRSARRSLPRGRRGQFFSFFPSSPSEREKKKKIAGGCAKGEGPWRRARWRGVPALVPQRGLWSQVLRPEQKTTEVMKPTAAKQLKTAAERKTTGGKKKMHISDLLKPFDEHLEACGSAKLTRESYNRSARKFIQFLELSDRKSEAEEITTQDIKDFLCHCEEVGEKRSSVILRLNILKKFFGWLRQERMIAQDPAASIPVPREEKNPPRYASPQQIESLLNQPNTNTPTGLRDRALMVVLYSAGLRISEAQDLEIRDVNFEEGFIHVRNGKGGRARTVPMGATASQWLSRYMLEGRKKLLSCSCAQLIFLNQSGERFSRQHAAAAVRAYARSAGLPSFITPHLLRHACAGHMLAGGAGLVYIQEQLGHARMESTRIYLAVRSEDLKSVHSACHPRA
jgi:integrase/recombinase XerD